MGHEMIRLMSAFKGHQKRLKVRKKVQTFYFLFLDFYVISFSLKTEWKEPVLLRKRDWLYI